MLTDWLKLGERVASALERMAAAAEERNRILGSDHEDVNPLEFARAVAGASETRINGTRVG